MKKLFILGIGITLFFIILYIILGLRIKCVKGLPYLNPQLPIELRIKDLLSRMTLEEKVRQMDMYNGESLTSEGEFSRVKAEEVIGNLGIGAIHDLYPTSANIPNRIQEYIINNTHFKIPVLFVAETLHGYCGVNDTIFPQSIALASTWNKELIKEIGEAIAGEARACGIHMGLSPVLDLARDPRWGRTEETYGEDPYLSSQIGLYMIRGMQGGDFASDKAIVATPKHFAAYGIPQGGLNTAPSHIGQRELMEVFIPPFKEAITRGRALALMSAYNEIDGVPCTGNKWLLTNILRDEWKFKGFVVSDLGAISMLERIHSTADCLKESIRQAIDAGVDMQYYDYDHNTFQKTIINLVEEGKLSKETINRAVGSILRVKFILGLFDNPYTNPELAEEVVHCNKHKEIALQSAREAVCLLKNQNNLLPLKKDIKSIAVIGPNANVARLGDYSGKGGNLITVLDGIKNIVSPQTMVHYEKGLDIKGIDDITPIDSVYITPPNGGGSGLEGEYFNNMNLEGEPVFVKIDSKIDFNWMDSSPDRRIRSDFFSIRWTGKLKSDITTEGWIGATCDDGIRLWINGELLIDEWYDHPYTTTTILYRFEAGKKYEIKFEYHERGGGAAVKLGWNLNPTTIRKAVEIAKESEVAVLVMGEAPYITSGENYDVVDLDLPGYQLELVKAIYETGTPTIVVLINGRPLSINWIAEKIPAIIEAWYPGESGGTAIAEVLFGDYNPAGRLPVTFPKSVGQLPIYYNYKPSAKRYYTSMDWKPLYTFGYGLSYTKFSYNNLKIVPEKVTPKEAVVISVNVENIGDREGDEVVQLYIRDMVSSVTTPVKQLKGFERIYFNPGQRKNVSFILETDDLAIFDKNNNWVIEPGLFEVMVGGNSEEGIRGTFEITKK